MSKFLDMINDFMQDPSADVNAILIFIDIAFRMGFITDLDKSDLLAKLKITEYNITEIIDSIITIYETREYLDYTTVLLALRKYTRLGVITEEKRNQILSSIVRK